VLRRIHWYFIVNCELSGRMASSVITRSSPHIACSLRVRFDGGKKWMALVGYVQRCNGNDAAHRGDGIYKPRRAEAARDTNASRACDARSLVSGVHKGLYAHRPSRGVRRNGGRPGM
jgi:hypothetical protein